jgi:RHS repeat-associated protein
LAGVWTIEHMYFNGKRVARRELLPGYSLRYHFSDHLGSVSVVTNVTETTKDESDYYPFGGERIITNSDPNQYKFTGKERDGESGLDYFIARSYSSNLGRFLQPDEFAGGPVDAFSSNDPLPDSPLPYADITNPQSLNKYTYTYNNPLTYVDPDGHNPALIQKLLELGQRALPYLQRAGAAVQRAGIAAYNWATRASNSPAAQDALQAGAELVSGTPIPGRLTLGGGAVSKAFGGLTDLTENALGVAGAIGGRTSKGAEIAGLFTKTGDNVTASIFAAFNPSSKDALGTLRTIEQGVTQLGKDQGAKSVTIEAVAVINEKLGQVLVKQGFEKVTKVLEDGSKVEVYSKTIAVP